MTDPLPILGLHHVTALAGDPARNDRFWTGVMKLRRVKATVNFDDPETYHLYFGDENGSPGTLWTTFPHPRSVPGSPGPGEVARTVYRLPADAIERVKAEVEHKELDGTLRFHDPDRTALGVAVEPADRPRFDHVELRLRDTGPTERFLKEVFGFVDGGDGVLHREGARNAGGVRVRPDSAFRPSGGRRLGAGSVHHAAFRVADHDAQAACLEELARLGFSPTPVQDRQYFHSVYFREPGGVIFEIATDPPGFATDEPPEGLGTKLQLPAWLEPRRERIEAGLVPIHGLGG